MILIGIVYFSFNKTEISLTNDRYIVVQKSQEITEKVTPIVKTYILQMVILYLQLYWQNSIFLTKNCQYYIKLKIHI